MKGTFVDLAMKIVLKDQPEFLAVGHTVFRILGLHREFFLQLLEPYQAPPCPAQPSVGLTAPCRREARQQVARRGT